MTTCIELSFRENLKKLNISPLSHLQRKSSIKGEWMGKVLNVCCLKRLRSVQSIHIRLFYGKPVVRTGLSNVSIDSKLFIARLPIIQLPYFSMKMAGKKVFQYFLQKFPPVQALQLVANWRNRTFYGTFFAINLKLNYLILCMTNNCENMR